MRIIPLTQGQMAQVDDEDFERFSKYRWRALRTSNTFYAVRWGSEPNHHIMMHHEVLGESPGSGYEVDHRDGSGVNNQQLNLRWVTNKQNQMNRRSFIGTSQYKGVCWNKASRKWQTQIRVNSRLKYLGRFDSEEDAARAYDAAALEHFGEFARLNFAA